MNSYDAGDSIRLIGTFTTLDGTPVDPTAVYLRIVPPAQFGGIVPGTTVGSYDGGAGHLTRATQGSYFYDITPLPSGTPGVWTYEYRGTGVVQAAFVGQFMVRFEPR